MPNINQRENELYKKALCPKGFLEVISVIRHKPCLKY